jgi:hypothetical protein
VRLKGGLGVAVFLLMPVPSSSMAQQDCAPGFAAWHCLLSAARGLRGAAKVAKEARRRVRARVVFMMKVVGLWSCTCGDLPCALVVYLWRGQRYMSSNRSISKS